MQAGLKQTETQAKSSAQGMTLGFDSLRDAAKVAGAAVAGSAIIDWLKGCAEEAADAAKNVRDLEGAMKVAGVYSKDASQGMQDWAEKMQNATGFADDVVMKVSAMGYRMGLSTEATKEYVKASLDLGAQFGDVDSAAQSLMMAYQGQTRGLKQYGITVDAASMQTKGFGVVLNEVGRLYGGKSLANVENYGSQVRLLTENYNAFRESIGTPLLAAATDWLSMLNGMIAKHREMNDALKKDTKDSAFGEQAKQLDAVSKMMDYWKKQGYGMGEGSPLVKLQARYDELLASMVALRKESERSGGKPLIEGNAKSVIPVKADPAALKKAQDERNKALDDHMKAAQENLDGELKAKQESLLLELALEKDARDNSKRVKELRLRDSVEAMQLENDEKAQLLLIQIAAENKEREESRARRIEQQNESNDLDVARYRKDQDEAKKRLADRFAYGEAEEKRLRSIEKLNKQSNAGVDAMREFDEIMQDTTRSAYDQAVALGKLQAKYTSVSQAAATYSAVEKALLASANAGDLDASTIKSLTKLGGKSAAIEAGRQEANSALQTALKSGDSRDVADALKAIEKLNQQERDLSEESRALQQSTVTKTGQVKTAADQTTAQVRAAQTIARSVGTSTNANIDDTNTELGDANTALEKIAQNTEPTAATASPEAVLLAQINTEQEKQTVALKLIDSWTWLISQSPGIGIVDSFGRYDTDILSRARSRTYIGESKYTGVGDAPLTRVPDGTGSSTGGDAPIIVYVSGVVGDLRAVAIKLQQALDMARRYREAA
jgi:hypothetical protein